MNVNPITRLDYPDLDVIRVEDTYYMVSTTMHFMPGCEILQSFDLVHWEHVTYVYETLDHTDAQQLKSGQNIYGQGMWAASLRYHEGRFWICFVANDTRKTYLYTSEKNRWSMEKAADRRLFIMTALYYLMRMAEAILYMEMMKSGLQN